MPAAVSELKTLQRENAALLQRVRARIASLRAELAQVATSKAALNSARLDLFGPWGVSEEMLAYRASAKALEDDGDGDGGAATAAPGGKRGVSRTMPATSRQTTVKQTAFGAITSFRNDEAYLSPNLDLLGLIGVPPGRHAVAFDAAVRAFPLPFDRCQPRYVAEADLFIVTAVKEHALQLRRRITLAFRQQQQQQKPAPTEAPDYTRADPRHFSLGEWEAIARRVKELLRAGSSTYKKDHNDAFLVTTTDLRARYFWLAHEVRRALQRGGVWTGGAWAPAVTRPPVPTQHQRPPDPTEPPTAEQVEALLRECFAAFGYFGLDEMHAIKQQQQQQPLAQADKNASDDNDNDDHDDDDGDDDSERGEDAAVQQKPNAKPAAKKAQQGWKRNEPAKAVGEDGIDCTEIVEYLCWSLSPEHIAAVQAQSASQRIETYRNLFRQAVAARNAAVAAAQPLPPLMSAWERGKIIMGALRGNGRALFIPVPPADYALAVELLVETGHSPIGGGRSFYAVLDRLRAGAANPVRLFRDLRRDIGRRAVGRIVVMAPRDAGPPRARGDAGNARRITTLAPVVTDLHDATQVEALQRLRREHRIKDVGERLSADLLTAEYDAAADAVDRCASATFPLTRAKRKREERERRARRVQQQARAKAKLRAKLRRTTADGKRTEGSDDVGSSSDDDDALADRGAQNDDDDDDDGNDAAVLQDNTVVQLAMTLESTAGATLCRRQLYAPDPCRLIQWKLESPHSLTMVKFNLAMLEEHA